MHPAFLLYFGDGTAELHRRYPSEVGGAYRSRVIACGTTEATKAAARLLGFEGVVPEPSMRATGVL